MTASTSRWYRSIDGTVYRVRGYMIWHLAADGRVLSARSASTPQLAQETGQYLALAASRAQMAGASTLSPTTAAYALRVVCAWCRVEMRTGAEPCSHGCCDTCSARVLAEAEQPARRIA